MIIDKLFEAVKTKGHVCLGLDTDFSYLPESYAAQFSSKWEAVFSFNKDLIDATIDVVACYKVQIAYYEALGVEGLVAYVLTLRHIREKGGISIADIKRGDIAKTAEMYAQAHFTGDFEADFITLSPYMGMDSIEPYLPYIQNAEKGIFVLIRTSNPGAADFEYLDLKNEDKLYREVGRRMYELGQKYLGQCGYSSIGGVMGCTHSDEAVSMRKNLKSMFFLIPGYGAQGGKAEDIALYLTNGNGGVVNASRSILQAWQKVENGAEQFAQAAREEAIRMRDDILKHCK